MLEQHPKRNHNLSLKSNHTGKHKMDIVGKLRKKKTWVLLLGRKEKQRIREVKGCIALGHSHFSSFITVERFSKKKQKTNPQSLCSQIVEILTRAEHRHSSKRLQVKLPANSELKLCEKLMTMLI